MGMRMLQMHFILIHQSYPAFMKSFRHGSCDADPIHDPNCSNEVPFLFLLVILLLLFGLGDGQRNTVQVTLAGLGDPASTLLLVLLKDTDLLKSLEDLALDVPGGIDVVRWAGSSVPGATVSLDETANTDSLAEVDMTSDGSSADVEPNAILVSC